MSYRTPTTFADLQPDDEFSFADEPANRLRREQNESGYRFAGSYSYAYKCEDPTRAVINVRTHEQAQDEYQAARDAEAKAKAEACAAFHGTMRKVARILSMTWKPDNYEGRSVAGGSLINGDEIIHAGTGGYRAEGRIRAYGIVPHEDRGTRSTGEVTMSADKSPEAIAKDIARRILPEYRAALAKAQEAKAKADDYKARKASVMAAMVKAGATNHGDAERFHFDGGSGTVSGDSVRMELYGIEPAQAVRILAMLRKSKAEA